MNANYVFLYQMVNAFKLLNLDRDKFDSFVILLIGRRGSGKTTLLMELLCGPDGLMSVQDEIMFVCPNIRFDRKYADYMADTYGDRQWRAHHNKKFHSLDYYSPERIKEIFDERDPKDRDHIMIVLDDCISESRFRRPGSSDVLSRTATAGRNRLISVVITSQQVRSIHSDVRKQSDYAIVFKTDNMAEVDALYSEFGWGTKKDWVEWFQNTLTEEYTALLLAQNKGDRKSAAKIIKLQNPKHIPSEKK